MHGCWVVVCIYALLLIERDDLLGKKSVKKKGLFKINVMQYHLKILLQKKNIAAKTLIGY